MMVQVCFCKVENVEYWFIMSKIKYLGCKLSLSIFSCRKVLRKFFVFDSKLSKTYTNIWDKMFWDSCVCVCSRQQTVKNIHKHMNLRTSYLIYCTIQSPIKWKKKGEAILTVLAFFCRSTIWERRCVISSCWREASSVFLASSSAILEIWMLDCPSWGEREHLFCIYRAIILHLSPETTYYSLSSLTQSFTSCCSFSSYDSVSDFSWLD